MATVTQDEVDLWKASVVTQAIFEGMKQEVLDIMQAWANEAFADEKEAQKAIGRVQFIHSFLAIDAEDINA